MINTLCLSFDIHRYFKIYKLDLLEVNFISKKLKFCKENNIIEQNSINLKDMLKLYFK